MEEVKADQQTKCIIKTTEDIMSRARGVVFLILLFLSLPASLLPHPLPWALWPPGLRSGGGRLPDCLQ